MQRRAWELMPCPVCACGAWPPDGQAAAPGCALPCVCPAVGQELALACNVRGGPWRARWRMWHIGIWPGIRACAVRPGVASVRGGGCVGYTARGGMMMMWRRRRRRASPRSYAGGPRHVPFGVPRSASSSSHLRLQRHAPESGGWFVGCGMLAHPTCVAPSTACLRARRRTCLCRARRRCPCQSCVSSGDVPAALRLLEGGSSGCRRPCSWRSAQPQGNWPAQLRAIAIARQPPPPRAGDAHRLRSRLPPARSLAIKRLSPLPPALLPRHSCAAAPPRQHTASHTHPCCSSHTHGSSKSTVYLAAPGRSARDLAKMSVPPSEGAVYTPTNVLITGGAGFIASHVAIRLAKAYPQYKARRAATTTILARGGLVVRLAPADLIIDRGLTQLRLPPAASSPCRSWCWTSWTTAPA